jgi:hypothetical protein
MKTTDLLKAKPSQRAAIVVDAFVYLKSRTERLALDLKILNGWLDILPTHMANETVGFPDMDKLQANIDALEKSADELTLQLIENSHKMQRFMDAVAFYRKYGESKTISE